MSNDYSPQHYKSPIDAIDVADAWNLSRYLFSTLKYIQRNGKKEESSRVQDLLKAIWYLVYEATGSKSCADRVCGIVAQVADDPPATP